MPEILPLLAFTVACGEEARAQAQGCEASFRHFHPDIPFLRLGDEESTLLAGGNPPAWPGELVSLRSPAGWFLSRHVKRLIYLDSDLWVLGRLDHLIDDTIPTAWTRDCAAYTMGVPDCPRINSGVLASSDPAFWPAWTAPQYGCLVPALPKFYFNQLALRLIVKASAVRGRIVDGQLGAPFYNVCINEQPGEWRVENDAAFKGTERALIYHQAGEEKRGIEAAPAVLRPFLRKISAGQAPGRTIDFAALWQKDGAAFTKLITKSIQRWPTMTLNIVLAREYAKTPGFYRSVAPAAWDRHRSIKGTRWQRFWHQEWKSYIYKRADDAQTSPAG